MASNVDGKVAMSLLNEVEENVEQELGNLMASPVSLDDDPTEVTERAYFCKEMVRQCELAEKKAPGDNEVLLRSLILKAQLYGNWQRINSVRGNHKKAYRCYENALQLVNDPEAEAEIRCRLAYACRVLVGPGRGKSVENFEKVIQLVGADSELGIECAKELEKEKSKKGVCFIATAVYESEFTPEVITLQDFRDNVLLRSVAGKAFVKIYYLISPLFARIISPRKALRDIIKNRLLDKLVKYAIQSK